jgi:hypothetical protein
MIFEDLFDSSVQVSGSAGISSINKKTHNFGPHELSNEIDLYNHDLGAYFRRWYFKGPDIVGSPYVFGYLGAGVDPNCFFYPKGPIIGVRSYLHPNTSRLHFCGVDFAYNTCSCISALQ